jgi:uncharacterized RmlC-like cupin family protein
MSSGDMKGSEESRAALRGLLHVAAEQLSSETAQTSGMQRLAAISARHVGSSEIWMGLTIVSPGFTSAAHHHGRSETGIYVVSGTPKFRFREDGRIIELAPEPGDFIFVPPFAPHIESNDGDDDAVVVIARSTDEAIVENLDSL